MEQPATRRPPTQAERARWGLPFVCGAHAVVLLVSLRVGGIVLAGLALIACYGLIERRRWGYWLAGAVAVVSGLWDGLFVLASLVSRSGSPYERAELIQAGGDLVLCGCLLVLLMLADDPRKGPGAG